KIVEDLVAVPDDRHLLNAHWLAPSSAGEEISTVVLITLVSLRQTEPLDRPAVLISSPAEDGASQ
ncbi:MAG: hypothetical protein AAFX39_00540, partial [Pseudomonadota bacterium]